jgi:hypothetical protein
MSVQPACGCTSIGDWSKEIAPGKTGVIVVQFNSARFNGPVYKSVKVTLNDPTTPTVELHLRGTVWKPVELSASVAFLKVAADSQRGSASVRITNNMEEPLALSTAESDNRAFAVRIVTNQPGKEFHLVITTVPPLLVGPLQGKITVTTSSTNAPVLTVTAFASVPPIIAVTPTHLLLPAGPLPEEMVRSVMIQNNATNAIEISDADINTKDVDVAIVEVQPGRSFRARLAFPKGFEIPQGRQVEFTFKTSHSLSPLVKVPITHAPRPTKPPAASPVLIAPPQPAGQ